MGYKMGGENLTCLSFVKFAESDLMAFLLTSQKQDFGKFTEKRS